MWHITLPFAWGSWKYSSLTRSADDWDAPWHLTDIIANVIWENEISTCNLYARLWGIQGQRGWSDHNNHKPSTVGHLFFVFFELRFFPENSLKPVSEVLLILLWSAISRWTTGQPTAHLLWRLCKSYSNCYQPGEDRQITAAPSSVFNRLLIVNEDLDWIANNLLWSRTSAKDRGKCVYI